MVLDLDFDKTDYTVGISSSLSHLLKPWEFVLTPDHFGCWKRHVAWSKQDGKTLREHVTERFASNMVFMSLLLNSELSLLFNSADVPTRMRECLQTANYRQFEFYIGVLIIISLFITLFAMLATFTVWGMASSVSEENALCVLRSSIGQYATQLPSRLVATSLCLFLTWSSLFLFVLLPPGLAAVILCLSMTLYLHVVNVYSAFGRLIMHTGAMGCRPIFQQAEEKSLLPADLTTRMGEMAEMQLQRRMSVTVQYKDKEFQTAFKKALKANHNRHISQGSLGSLSLGSLPDSYYASPFPYEEADNCEEFNSEPPLGPMLGPPPDPLLSPKRQVAFTRTTTHGSGNGGFRTQNFSPQLTRRVSLSSIAEGGASSSGKANCDGAGGRRPRLGSASVIRASMKGISLASRDQSWDSTDSPVHFSHDEETGDGKTPPTSFEHDSSGDDCSSLECSISPSGSEPSSPSANIDSLHRHPTLRMKNLSTTISRVFSPSSKVDERGEEEQIFESMERSRLLSHDCVGCRNYM